MRNNYTYYVIGDFKKAVFFHFFQNLDYLPLLSLFLNVLSPFFMLDSRPEDSWPYLEPSTLRKKKRKVFFGIYLPCLLSSHNSFPTKSLRIQIYNGQMDKDFWNSLLPVPSAFRHDTCMATLPDISIDPGNTVL